MNNFNSSLADAFAVISNASQYSQDLKFEAEQLERYVRHQSEFMGTMFFTQLNLDLSNRISFLGR